LCETKASEIQNVIGSNSRVTNLSYGIELIIFNDLGIRLWSKNDIVYQMGITYQVNPEEKNMPNKEFDGTVEVKNIPIDKHTNTKQVIERLNLDIDQDSLRFKVELYNGIIEDFKISFIVDKESKVKNFFIAKSNIQQALNHQTRP